MAYIDKTRPSPSWTADQLVSWHTQLAKMGDVDQARKTLTNGWYVTVWDWVETGKWVTPEERNKKAPDVCQGRGKD